MDVIPEVRALFVADKASVRDGGQGQQRESDALDDHEAAGHFQSFLEFLTLGIIRVFTYFLPTEIGAPVMETIPVDVLFREIEMTRRHAQWLTVIKKTSNARRPLTPKATTRH
jgi:hypothetical protein